MVPREQKGAIVSFAPGDQPLWSAPAACNRARRFDLNRIWLFSHINIKIAWFAPPHYPAPAIHHSAAKTGRIQRIIERYRHAHFGGVSNDGPLAKDTFYFVGHPAHTRHESWEIQQEQKTVIWFDADNLHILLRHQFAKQFEQSRVPIGGLAQEGERKADREAHTLLYQVKKHARSRIIAILCYFSKVAFVHAIVKEAMIDLLY